MTLVNWNSSQNSKLVFFSILINFVLTLETYIWCFKDEFLHSWIGVISVSLLIDYFFSYIFFTFLQLKEKQSTEVSETAEATQKQVAELEENAAKYRTETEKIQLEIDRLLVIMKEMEDEKHAKDNQIKDLQEWVIKIRLEWSFNLNLNSNTYSNFNSNLNLISNFNSNTNSNLNKDFISNIN